MDDWDNFWDTEVSKSIQVDNDPVLVFWGSELQLLLEVLDEVWDEFALNKLGISELAIDLDWVT